MSDTEETLQTAAAEQQQDQTPPPASEEPTLSAKRRSALVTYLGFLFAIAFLFVAIMFLMETKRLQVRNQELNDKSQKTLTGLTANINALQEENAELQQKLDEQDAEVQLMKFNEKFDKDEIKNLKQENSQLKKKLNEQTKNAEDEKTELEEKLQEQTQRTENAILVSELLHKAM
ncbi:MAG: hypothetical protein IIY70_02985, partial [Oscillospiraceae bacterium]|nr:hypothetical protein [Oscillospiraceae bacterium]